MSIRFYLDRIYSATIVVLLTMFMSYDLADLLLRLANPPQNLLQLAGRQLDTIIVAGAVASALAALIAARHSHRSGTDYSISASRSPLQRSGVQFATVLIPVALSWLLFSVISAVHSGLAEKFFSWLTVCVIGVASLAVSVALGQTVGGLVRPVLAVPLAFVASYAFSGVFAIFGDDSWAQWLGTGFGDSLNGNLSQLWSAGEFVWFCGLTMVLLGISTLRNSLPRRVPVSYGAMTAALLIIGIVLLIVNGPDASTNDAV
ncbi:hypothetical protein AB0J83_03425 [Actinoplanes sp. NPDC049596]|uniref:hypothetical protein n=1 Tax=unclassified Actinoplanes TaxID=2626549 RepID=UPI00343372C2